MATNAFSFRGLLKPSLRAVILAQFLVAVLFVLAASGQTPPGTIPLVTDSEVTAFIQAHQNDHRALLTIQSNPKRVPLLLGAIKRDPAGFWVHYLHGACFIHDRARAGRLPAAERASLYSQIIAYLSSAQTTISNATQKAPQAQSLEFNLNLINKDLALVRADVAAGANATRPFVGAGIPSNAPPAVGPTPARNANVAAARAKVCESHLTQIDLAKEMWKVDYNKPATATPSVADLTGYIPYKVFPRCPDSGTYVIGRLNQKPTCSFPGHVLPPRPR
jgi:hypothetical protein